MPFNGSGTYTLPGAALVSGDVVSASENNDFRNDVAIALTDCITRDGQSPATANIPMGGFRLTNLGAAISPSDAVRYDQLPSQIHTATQKTTPVSNDEVAIADSENSYSLKKVLWSQVKEVIDGSVTTAKIADSNVTTAKIADSNVTTAKIADSNVTTAKIADSNVTTAKLANSGFELGFRNRLINGDFNIWQRGTSFPASAGIVYTADRWAFYRQSLGTGATVTKISSTGIVGSSGCGIRVQRDSGNSSTEPIVLSQCLSSDDAKRLQGQTLTLSFKQRTGANISSASIGISITTGTGTDQGVNSARSGSWTSQGSLSSSGFSTGASSFTSVSLQFAIPSNATELMINFVYTPTGTAGAADYFDIADVQLEIGQTKTPFEVIPYGLELALCQRYFIKYGGNSLYEAFAYGSTYTSTLAFCLFSFPVEMRSSPSVEWSQIRWTDVGSPYGVSGLAINDSGTKTTLLQVDSSGMVAYRPGYLTANNSLSAYVSFSSEL